MFYNHYFEWKANKKKPPWVSEIISGLVTWGASHLHIVKWKSYFIKDVLGGSELVIALECAVAGTGGHRGHHHVRGRVLKPALSCFIDIYLNILMSRKACPVFTVCLSNKNRTVFLDIILYNACVFSLGIDRINCKSYVNLQKKSHLILIRMLGPLSFL